MTSARTTIVLGARERSAAKKLASFWGVTPSEAIRRALLKVEAQELAPQRDRLRRERLAAFEKLVGAFEGYDPEAELRQLREDRDAW